jgi:beta-lactamase class A
LVKMAASRLLRLFWVLVLSGSMAACVSPRNPQIGKRVPVRPPIDRPPTKTTQTPPPAPPQRTPSSASISNDLASYVREQWRVFPGKTGVAIVRIDGGGGMVGERLNDLFPQQSVSKTWVALTILDLVDQGRISLDQNVRITPNDVAVFYQPLAARVASQGEVNETVRRLLEYSITQSDNTANDSLLRTAGGPDAVRAFIAKHGLGQIRFGPGERLLQSGIAGLQWRQEYSVGRRFYAERDKLPYNVRKAALDRYIANPVDGATPSAIANGLARLARGELLSPASTQIMLGLMGRVKSGPNRLKSGVPGGWGFVHKTGTGQDLPPVSTGYNDIGIMTAPDGTRYAVVVMMAETTASVPGRMAFMRSISRAVADYHR